MIKWIVLLYSFVMIFASLIIFYVDWYNFNADDVDTYINMLELDDVAIVLILALFWPLTFLVYAILRIIPYLYLKFLKLMITGIDELMRQDHE